MDGLYNYKVQEPIFGRPISGQFDLLVGRSGSEDIGKTKLTVWQTSCKKIPEVDQWQTRHFKTRGNCDDFNSAYQLGFAGRTRVGSSSKN